MPATRKTIQEILAEFAEEYVDHPERRAVARGYAGISECHYRTADGRRCAFGFFCAPNAPLVEGLGAFSREPDLPEAVNGDDCLRPEYRGHPADFWRALQSLHDSCVYWGPSGLNPRGLARLKEIERLFAAKG